MDKYSLPAPLQDIEFEIIRRIVYEQAGIKLSEQKKGMVQSRLVKRLKEIKCPNFGKYIKIARLNAEERAIMLNLITTNVTDFFRENQHFKFIKSFLPEYLRQTGPNKVLKVWSAACSTGQEPYSIAITLNEFYRQHPGDFKIIASDINTEVLQHAARGIYKWEQVEEIPHDLLKKYFKLGQGPNKGLVKVKEILQHKIDFRQINLADPDPDFPVENRLDFIFCRNVFIYFDQETKKRAVKKFYKKLHNGGCLFLGHSESLNTFDTTIGNWIPREHTVYIKDEGGEAGAKDKSSDCR